MSRFGLTTEDGAEVTYGHDHVLGYFADVKRRGQRRREYNALVPSYSHLEGGLRFLVECEVFSEDDLTEALLWLEQNDNEPLSKGGIVPVNIVCNLKEWSRTRPK